MAPIGQTSAQAPCPIQLVGSMRAARPSTSPSTSPSGHTRVQFPQPMQRTGSMKGCSDAGSVRPALTESVSAATARVSRWRRSISVPVQSSSAGSA